MRKKLLVVILCASMLFPASVSAEVLGYEATLDTYTKEKKTPQQFQIDDGAGNTVNVLAKSDTLYVTAKNTEIRSNPGDSGTELRSVILGTKLERVAVCDNGWSKVTFQKKGEDKIIGYVSDSVLSDTEIVNKFTDTVTAAQDSDILDYPGKKDGEVVGEVLQDDELKRTGTVDAIWSRIVYTDDSGFCGCGGWCNFHRWFRKYRSWRTDRNAGISIFGRDTETTGNIPDHALLSVQHLLRTMGEWNYFHRSNGHYQPYDRSGSESDPIRFQSSDQWTGLCCRGLWRSDPDQLH